MKATTAVILLNWNGWRDTIECLKSLAKLSHSSYAIVVVDNNSTDGSMGYITQWLRSQEMQELAAPLVLRPLITQSQLPGFGQTLSHHTVTLLQADDNGGFAAGNNLGLRLALNAQCDYMWLLNNDTTVAPHALTALEKRMGDDSKIGMVGSVLCYYDQPDIIQAVGGVQFNYWRARGKQVGQGLSLRTADLQSLATLPLSYIAGASMLVSKPFLENVGLMYEGYFLYFEEIDWAARAQPNWSLATAKESLVFHKEGGSIGTSSRATKSALAQYYLTRNGLGFFKRHKPLFLPVAIANSLYESLKQALTGQWLLAKCTLLALYRGSTGEHGQGQFK